MCPCRAYYNEVDPHAAAWLRELMADGLIMEGIVDERDIKEVQPADLRGFSRCHFFAGIGGWDRALQLARWPDHVVAWTGSCPCQPFSSAGKRKGAADARHLWPEFMRLIRACRPPVVFGEQVASAEVVGTQLEAAFLVAVQDGDYARANLLAKRLARKRGFSYTARWVDRVHSDLEDTAYSVRFAVLGAHSVGAPHTRQRLFWVADAKLARRATPRRRCAFNAGSEPQPRRNARGVGNSERAEPGPRDGQVAPAGLLRDRPAIAGDVGFWSDAVWHTCRDGRARRIPAEPVFQFTFDGISDIMGHGWTAFVSTVKERILSHAKKADARPGKILRALWCSYAAQEIRRDARRYGAVCASQVLLVALCELARSSQYVFDFHAQDVSEIQEGTLRTLWKDIAARATSCSSHQQGLARSETGELADPMYRLSSREDAQQKVAEAVSGVRFAAQGARVLHEALSEMEEVWRSVENKDASSGESARFAAGVSIIVAASGFPLSDGLPGRVGLLRGAGNAIVPQVAAEFVTAYVETRG